MEGCDLAPWLRKDGASGTRLQMPIDLSMAAGHAEIFGSHGAEPRPALVGLKGPAEVGGAETSLDTGRLPVTNVVSMRSWDQSQINLTMKHQAK
jgi:hypothetical protein